jgi:hypothetical protein
MAVNKPNGDNARKGAVRKRSQLQTKIEGEDTWTKRSSESGQIHGSKESAGDDALQGRAERAVTLAAGPLLLFLLYLAGRKEPPSTENQRIFSVG